MQDGKTRVSFDDLAIPFAAEVVDHLRKYPKQGTSESSRFLNACRSHLNGELGINALHEATAKLGFVNVVDAFHNVHGEPIPSPFYVRDVAHGGKHLVFTDKLFKLTESIQFDNLQPEVEARWTLVETAWNIEMNPRLLQVCHDREQELLYLRLNQSSRVDLSSARDALNGYQKGKCFYSFKDVSINNHDANFCDVDHFFPHVNRQVHLEQGQADLNGVWNLVLCDSAINRFEKTAKLPHLRFLERLHNRNEFYINSKHPLSETIQNLTGNTEGRRRAFLQRQYDIARSTLCPIWVPKEELPGTF